MWIGVLCSILIAGLLVRPSVRRLASRARANPSYINSWASRAVPGLVPIGEIVPGSRARITGVVRRITVPGDGIRRIEVLVSDQTGEIWLDCRGDSLRRFLTGSVVVAEGLAQSRQGKLCIVDPKVDDEVLAASG